MFSKSISINTEHFIREKVLLPFNGNVWWFSEISLCYSFIYNEMYMRYCKICWFVIIQLLAGLKSKTVLRVVNVANSWFGLLCNLVFFALSTFYSGQKVLFCSYLTTAPSPLSCDPCIVWGKLYMAFLLSCATLGWRQHCESNIMCKQN